MSISYSICPKVSQTSDIWRDKERHWRNTEKIVRTKGSGDTRGGSMPRSYTYAGEHPAAHKYSTIYGIPQGKKHTNDFRPTCKFKI